MSMKTDSLERKALKARRSKPASGREAFVSEQQNEGAKRRGSATATSLLALVEEAAPCRVRVCKLVRVGGGLLIPSSARRKRCERLRDVS